LHSCIAPVARHRRFLLAARRVNAVVKDLVVTSRLILPGQELQFSFARSGGPGGQNVNKVNSKAVLRWNVKSSASLPESIRSRFLARNKNRVSEDGIFVLTSERYRDQGRNVADCLAKLRDLLREAATPPRRRIPTKLPRAVKESRLRSKRQTSERKSNRRLPPESE
jgi:ribosome-associated protein